MAGTPSAVSITGVNTRQLIIQHLYEHSKTSAFTRYSIPNNLINKVAETSSKTDTLVAAQNPVAVAAAKKTEAPTRIAGSTHVATVFQPNGFYYEIQTEFALGRQTDWKPTGARTTNSPLPVLTDDEKKDWGRGFGNPLVNPKWDAIYVMRAKLSQLRVDPMVGGFRLRWIIPAGWLFADGLPSSLYVEASSNPIVIQRKFLSPDAPHRPLLTTDKMPNGVFRVIVMQKYL